MFLFVAIIGVGILTMGLYTASTGNFVLVPIEEFSLFEVPTYGTGQAFEQPKSTPQPTLARGEMPLNSLIPSETILYVNKIPVATNFQSNFIPIYYDDMKTFSGKFGPYNMDPRAFIGVQLCTYPKSFPDMLNCESVPLNYANKYVSFARGYAYDEYIARQALKNYGVVYFVISPSYGNIAQSPTAIIKVIEHD
ncbi:hypothetical protein GF358_04325 [Candidatus Woesearchaeota archaeon]|nr:hypothetical protein [Candidatus Woesearchaeota archaeon]